MGFGMASGSTSDRLSYYDDKSNLQHKQENPNGECSKCPRKAKKQKGICLFKKLFSKKS